MYYKFTSLSNMRNFFYTLMVERNIIFKVENSDLYNSIQCDSYPQKCIVFINISGLTFS